MKLVKLRKLSLDSVATYSAIMWFVGSLIILLPFGLFFSFLGSVMPSDEFGNSSGVFMQGFGLFYMLVMPFFYAIVGTIINIIIAAIYNALSSKLGGMKFYIEE